MAEPGIFSKEDAEKLAAQYRANKRRPGKGMRHRRRVSQPGTVIPIVLTQVGGSQGTETTAASWTYDIKRLGATDNELTGVDPTSGGHHWKRPDVGFMQQATHGFGVDEDGLKVWIINEQIGSEACD